MKSLFSMHKDSPIIFGIFLLYAFLLIPLGYYKDPLRIHPGYYNIQKIDMGDDAGYYAYLRSGVIDGDFDFFNERRFWNFDHITSRGYSANYWFIGESFLWLPFFLLAHGVAWFYKSLGYSVPLDGYSFPYHALTFTASCCETFIGLILCYKVLQRSFSRTVCLTATILVYTATCLPYFTLIRNRMSHPGDLMAGFLFLLFFVKFRERQDQPAPFFVLWGILAGVLFDLRYVGVVYCSLPIGYSLKIFLDKSVPRQKKQTLKYGFAMGATAFAMTIFPQLAAWKILHGTFSNLNPVNPFLIISRFTLPSLLHSIKNLFLGANRGLALIEPIWIFGIAGLFLLFRKDKWSGGLFWVVFFGFCSVPVVIGDPASFGQRYLIPAFPLLAFGLAQLIDLGFKRRFHALVISLGLILSGWVYIQLLNFEILLKYDVPGLAFKIFWNIPLLIKKRILFRPLTYPYFLLRGGVSFDDYLDYFFLAIFPVLLAGLLFLCLLSTEKIIGAFQRNDGRAYRFLGKFSAAFLVSMAALGIFILMRHPGLSPEAKRERLIIAAGSQFWKTFDIEKEEDRLRKAEAIAPADENIHLIRADSYFYLHDYKNAAEHYRKALEANERSIAGLQLDRIEVLTGKKKYSPSLMKELEQEGDSTGEIRLWLGIFLLDRLQKPFEAIAYFDQSLSVNPYQTKAQALKNINGQYMEQRKRSFKKKRKQDESASVDYYMINTHLNKIRMDFISLDQEY